MISARVSHWPSTQEGKYTGSTYLTYFPWVSAKAQCKQAGTNLKIQITSWHAAKRIERQFLLRNYSRNMLAEAWGKVFCVSLFFFSLIEKVLKSIMSIWGGFLLLLLFLLLFKKTPNHLTAMVTQKGWAWLGWKQLAYFFVFKEVKSNGLVNHLGNQLFCGNVVNG